MGIAAYCWRGIYVDFAIFDPNTLTAFDPETGLERYGQDVVELAYSAEYCQLDSMPCEEHIEQAVLDVWDTFDRTAWIEDGQPPVTRDLLVSLLKALSAPAPPLSVARFILACEYSYW